MFEVCFSQSRAFLNCSEVFSEVITHTGVCYTYNMLDADDIYREGVVNAHGNHNRSSSWTLEDGYKSNGINFILSLHLVIKCKANFRP